MVLYAPDLALRATACFNLGHAYRQMGNLTLAKQYFEAALRLTPDLPMAMIGLGLIAQKNGNPAEAVRQYSRAMSAEPTDVGFVLLARALQAEGRLDEANAILERVARSSPNLAEAQRTADELLSGK